MITAGTDTSGFVQSIFANFEMELPRKEGDEVVMGDLIARAGNTGVTTESVIRVKIVSKPRMHPVTKEIIDWPERGFANEESWDLYLQGVYGVGEDEIGD